MYCTWNISEKQLLKDFKKIVHAMDGDTSGLKHFQMMSIEALRIFSQMRNKSFEGNHETLAAR